MDLTATAGVTGSTIATSETSSTASWAKTIMQGGVDNQNANAVHIGADAPGTIVNLVKAVLLTGVEGTDYGTGTVVHPTVSIADGTGDTIDATAITPGVAGDSIDTLETSAGASWGAVVLENGLDADTVTLGSVVYTFNDPLKDTPNSVLIGANAAATIVNLVAAIMGTAGEGTLYGTGTVANPDATAADGVGDTIDATAIVSGTVGNAIDTLETSDDASWAAADLASGVDGATGTVDVKVISLVE